MANLGGPKGPSDPTRGGGARILPLRPAQTQTQADKTQPDAGTPAAGAEQKATVPSVLQREVRLDLPDIKAPQGKGNEVIGSTREQGFVPNEGEQVRGAGVRARLAALGVKGADALPIKTAAKDGPRILTTPLGNIVDGSLVIESAKGLQKLEGVVRITGDLTIQESVVKSPDLLAGRSLIEVGGRITIEGNGALHAFDAFQSLERARGIYIGFNGALARIALPKLKELDAAFIVEGNPGLVEIQLPSFQKGGLYLHLHDNAALTTFTAPALLSLGDEISLVDNPRLTAVKVASREKPGEVGLVELRNNGANAYPNLYVRVR